MLHAVIIGILIFIYSHHSFWDFSILQKYVYMRSTVNNIWTILHTTLLINSSLMFHYNEQTVRRVYKIEKYKNYPCLRLTCDGCYSQCVHYTQTQWLFVPPRQAHGCCEVSYQLVATVLYWVFNCHTWSKVSSFLNFIMFMENHYCMNRYCTHFWE